MSLGIWGGGEWMEVGLCFEIGDVFVDGELRTQRLYLVGGVSRSSRFRIIVEGGVLHRDALSLVGGVSRSSRFCSAVTLELGGESPLSLLSSNLASMGHFDIVGDKLGYGCVGVELWLEIGDVVFEGDVGVECKMG